MCSENVKNGGQSSGISPTIFKYGIRVKYGNKGENESDADRLHICKLESCMNGEIGVN